MKKICLALVVLLIAAAVTVVSAETITGNIYDPQYELQEHPSAGNVSLSPTYCQPTLWHIECKNTSVRMWPTQIVLFNARISQNAEEYALTQNYRVYNGTLDYSTTVYADVQVEYQKIKYDVSTSQAFYTVVINLDWNETRINSLPERSSKTFGFSGNGLKTGSSGAILFAARGTTPEPTTRLLYEQYAQPLRMPYSERGYIQYYMYLDTFEQSYTVSADEYGINIDLIRVINGKSNPSKIIITNLDGSPIYESSTHVDINGTYNFPNTDVVVSLESLYTTQRYEIYRGTSGSGPTPGDNTTVTVYVRNSQTGAAIANSRIVIDALVDGDYYPVVNRTEPSGVFSVTLQPTGGGMPNPDSYRLIASADGYINQLPEINFTVDEYITSIYCSLDPITGGPEDENNTFIDFFVRDMSANPITGATVNFGGYTLITNSAGYTVLEVGKNSTYTYTVSKSGYGSLTGNVVIGADPRHTINTVLAPVVTPTKPTPIPTSTSISPTPTMTAPSGEPVSNWLDWFAAHFGMILGGGVEIGKIFMWLCFSVPVGVYVGKESKAGAAGFVAGAGIVTLFFVLIGWVPIWLLVLLALIIGLLYSKVFNNSDTGGGR